jgi:hypothetical protein
MHVRQTLTVTFAEVFGLELMQAPQEAELLLPNR